MFMTFEIRNNVGIRDQAANKVLEGRQMLFLASGERAHKAIHWCVSNRVITKLSPCCSRPDICHSFSTNVLLGSIFLHMKARKLWQKFRDKTA